MSRGMYPLLFWGAVLFTLPASGPALAASCLDNGCHQALAARRYLHGPVAAELAGTTGCVTCHQPNGGPCTPTRPGQFSLDKKGMCLLCHEKATGSPHTDTQSNCLDCHDPHGSETSPFMVRKAG
ncbi:MAG: hypothetical protein OEV91_04235 [Desulfobulbaceae bacterium]|nr:hypothetical protein [Desulfobulbaceae bacterium]